METNLKIYSITVPAFPGSVAIVYYDLEGALVRVDFNSDAVDKFRTRFGMGLPVRENILQSDYWQGCQIKDISAIDLSFEKFWSVYDYKIGNKPRVAKLWEKLSKEERILALGFIRRMRVFYQTKKIDVPYPETYLNQRRWENVLPS